MENIVAKQKQFFRTGLTKELRYRIKALETLADAVRCNEKTIFEALQRDFKKSEFETFTTEIVMLQEEISFLIKNIGRLARPQKQKRSFKVAFGKSVVYREPFGTVLVIAPWNYPLQLALAPLAGALAAGNTCIVKPSELTSATSAVIRKIISDNFAEEYVAVVEGGADETHKLIDEEPDYIFFTGSVKVGKSIMESAAKYLIPVTLELGGKSPCIIDGTFDIKKTAERIIWGKMLNAGQTCVAPDYILVERSVKERLIAELILAIEQFYGKNPQESPDFPRIITERHLDRLAHLLKTSGGSVAYGGVIDRKDRYCAPTLIDTPNESAPIMDEEIFGPLLPVVPYDTICEAVEYVAQKENPLALYMFTRNKQTIKKIIKSLHFGGGALNHTILHIVSPYLPFGGVGKSGTGHYHGDATFLTFSHEKSILSSGRYSDIPFTYPPYKNKLNIFKLLFK